MTFELQACLLEMVNIECKHATSNALSSKCNIAFERYHIHVPIASYFVKACPTMLKHLFSNLAYSLATLGLQQNWYKAT